MPQGRPRRNVEPKFEETYKEAEKTLKTKWISNCDRPEPEKPGTRNKPTDDVVSSLQEGLRLATGNLRRLAVDATGGPRRRAQTKYNVRAQKYRGDLAGYWNDVKIDMVDRIELARLVGDTRVSPKAVVRFKEALDWLELAEQKGGLGDWLDQWNDAVGPPEPDWQRMYEAGSAIKRGIEFSNGLMDKAFEGASRRDGLAQARTDLRRTLNAIAFEVSAEGEEALDGRKVDPGRKFDAVRERLKEINDRATHAEQVRTAVESMDLSSKWDEELSEWYGLSNDAMDGETLTISLQLWEAPATNVTELTEAIQSGTDVEGQAQLDAASMLDEAANELAKAIRRFLSEENISNLGGDPNDSDKRGGLQFDCLQIVSEINWKHSSLAQALTDPKARERLEAGAGAKALSDMLDPDGFDPIHVDPFSQHEMVKDYASQSNVDPFSQHEMVKDYASQPMLREFWVEQMRAMLDTLKTKDNEPALADDLAKAFPNDFLGPYLDSWTKRDPVKDTYGLAWQLVGRLRASKDRVAVILDEMPQRRDSLLYTLDAIVGFVIDQLAQYTRRPDVDDLRVTNY